MAAVQRWLDAYVAAWRSNNRAEITALFTEDAVYRPLPYDQPLRSGEANCQGVDRRPRSTRELDGGLPGRRRDRQGWRGAGGHPVPGGGRKTGAGVRQRVRLAVRRAGTVPRLRGMVGEAARKVTWKLGKTPPPSPSPQGEGHPGMLRLGRGDGRSVPRRH